MRSFFVFILFIFVVTQNSHSESKKQEEIVSDRTKVVGYYLNYLEVLTYYPDPIQVNKKYDNNLHPEFKKFIKNLKTKGLAYALDNSELKFLNEELEDIQDSCISDLALSGTFFNSIGSIKIKIYYLAVKIKDPYFKQELIGIANQLQTILRDYVQASTDKRNQIKNIVEDLKEKQRRETF